jgi:periplasmic protein TonB
MRDPAMRAERFDPSPKPSPVYIWEVAGKPVVVRLALELVDRLEREVVENFRSLNSRGSEIGGVLCGTMQSGSPLQISIEDYELIPCDYSKGPLYRFTETEAGRFARAVEQRSRGNGLRVTGFFRSHTRKGLALDAEDLTFFRGHFREPYQIALLIRPYASKASTAGVFIWENGAVHGESSYSEFPFRRSELERMVRTEPQPAHPGAAEAPAPEPPVAPPPKASARAQIVPIASRREITLAPPAELAAAAGTEPPAAPAPAPPTPSPKAPMGSAPPAPKAPIVEPPPPEAEAHDHLHPGEVTAPPAPERSKSGKLVWIAGGSAAALLLLSGMLIYPGLPHKSKRAALPQDSSALSLRVERSAGELLLSWNRDSETIQHAARATLSIVDGDQKENVDLDLNQLRNGSIVYSPSTSDVVFQLSVTGKDSSKVQSESVRVLRTRPSPMPDNATAKVTSAQPLLPQTPSKTISSNVVSSNPISPNPPGAIAPPATPENAQADTSKPGNPPLKAFHAETLAQRLRPVRPTDLPDAPGLGRNDQVAVAVPGMNLAPPAAPAPPVPPPPTPARPAPRVGGQVTAAEVVTRTNPDYPIAARQSRVQGVVVVTAQVGVDGTVKSAKAITGPPLLLNAAVAAVKQWTYRPALLNGSPVESETRIELRFTLDH